MQESVDNNTTGDTTRFCVHIDSTIVNILHYLQISNGRQAALVNQVRAQLPYANRFPNDSAVSV